MDKNAEVLIQGLKEGKQVADGVEFWIQFGSQEVKEYCKQKGYL